MSGIFGQILQGVLGGGQQGGASPIASILQQVLTTQDANGNQGVAAIISRFESAGLGQHVQSWVGNGQNVPVSPEQIGQAFSPEEIEGWAQQAGTTPDALRGILAEALPHAVDHSTPRGAVPDQSADLGGLIGRLFGGAGEARS